MVHKGATREFQVSWPMFPALVEGVDPPLSDVNRERLFETFSHERLCIQACAETPELWGQSGYQLIRNGTVVAHSTDREFLVRLAASAGLRLLDSIA